MATCTYTCTPIHVLVRKFLDGNWKAMGLPGWRRPSGLHVRCMADFVTSVHHSTDIAREQRSSM